MLAFTVVTKKIIKVESGDDNTIDGDKGGKS